MSVLITINLPQLCISYVHTVRPFNVVLLDKIVYMFRVSFTFYVEKWAKGGGQNSTYEKNGRGATAVYAICACSPRKFLSLYRLRSFGVFSDSVLYLFKQKIIR